MFSIAHIRVRVDVGGIHGAQQETGIREPDVIGANIGDARAGGSVHEIWHRRLRAAPGESGLTEVLGVGSPVPQLAPELKSMVPLDPGQAYDGLELLIQAIDAGKRAERLSGT